MQRPMMSRGPDDRMALAFARTTTTDVDRHNQLRRARRASFAFSAASLVDPDRLPSESLVSKVNLRADWCGAVQETNAVSAREQHETAEAPAVDTIPNRCLRAVGVPIAGIGLAVTGDEDVGLDRGRLEDALSEPAIVSGRRRWARVHSRRRLRLR